MSTEKELAALTEMIAGKPKMRQVPSIGRIVQYHFPDAGTMPALVTNVDEEGNPESKADLACFASNALIFLEDLPYATYVEGESESRTWDWLPYVAPVGA